MQALERLARRNGIPRAIFHDPTDQVVMQALATLPFNVLIAPEAVSDTPFRQAHPLIVFNPTQWSKCELQWCLVCCALLDATTCSPVMMQGERWAWLLWWPARPTLQAAGSTTLL